MTAEEYIVQGLGSLAIENAKLRAENDTLHAQFNAAMKTIQEQETELRELKQNGLLR